MFDTTQHYKLAYVMFSKLLYVEKTRIKTRLEGMVCRFLVPCTFSFSSYTYHVETYP